jgi:hypothetical protein
VKLHIPENPLPICQTHLNLHLLRVIEKSEKFDINAQVVNTKISHGLGQAARTFSEFSSSEPETSPRAPNEPVFATEVLLACM